MTETALSFAARCAVRVHGDRGPALLFGHGFCSDSDAFRHQVAALAPDHRAITYDLAGFGAADPALWDPARHATLHGYAEDLVRLLDELDLRGVTLVGASMSAMIALLASLERPDRVRALAFVGGSPRYLDDPPYVGGFAPADVDAFFAGIDSWDAWSDGVAGLLAGPGTLAQREVRERVRRVRPKVARVVARAIFEADLRDLPERCAHPTLIVHSLGDAVVPEAVTAYLHAHLPDSRVVRIPAVGHMPHRTRPEEFNRALLGFLADLDADGR